MRTTENNSAAFSAKTNGAGLAKALRRLLSAPKIIKISKKTAIYFVLRPNICIFADK